MDTFPLVVVASSAGDLEPIVELLSALPARGDQAFIIFNIRTRTFVTFH
jgi:hypothetical protein